MNKKIVAVLALLIVVTSVSAVSAFDLGDLFGMSGENKTVSIGGIDFNVPDGYKEDNSNATEELIESLELAGYDVDAKTYIKDSSVVTVAVANYSQTGLKTSLDTLGNATTVNNVEGYSYWDGGEYIFVYSKDDCMITFSTNDDKALGDFLIA